MTIQSLLGLCLSASLLLAGQSAMAGDGKGQSKQKNERAMQVQFDKKSGKKLTEADDSNLAAKAEAAAPLVDAKGMMPVESEAPQYHADGSVSAKLGTREMKFAVVTIGKDGKKILSHETIEEFNARKGDDVQSHGEETE